MSGKMAERLHRGRAMRFLVAFAASLTASFDHGQLGVGASQLLHAFGT
jgi:hypothetical protein